MPYNILQFPYLHDKLQGKASNLHIIIMKNGKYNCKNYERKKKVGVNINLEDISDENVSGN